MPLQLSHHSSKTAICLRVPAGNFRMGSGRRIRVIFSNQQMRLELCLIPAFILLCRCFAPRFLFDNRAVVVRYGATVKAATAASSLSSVASPGAHVLSCLWVACLLTAYLCVHPRPVMPEDLYTQSASRPCVSISHPSPSLGFEHRQREVTAAKALQRGDDCSNCLSSMAAPQTRKVARVICSVRRSIRLHFFR